MVAVNGEKSVDMKHCRQEVDGTQASFHHNVQQLGPNPNKKKQPDTKDDWSFTLKIRHRPGPNRPLPPSAHVPRPFVLVPITRISVSSHVLSSSSRSHTDLRHRATFLYFLYVPSHHSAITLTIQPAHHAISNPFLLITISAPFDRHDGRFVPA